MEGLQNAEKALQDLQKQLERAKEDKVNVEKKLEEADSTSLTNSSNNDVEVSQLRQEIEVKK